MVTKANLNHWFVEVDEVFNCGSGVYHLRFGTQANSELMAVLFDHDLALEFMMWQNNKMIQQFSAENYNVLGGK